MVDAIVAGVQAGMASYSPNGHLSTVSTEGKRDIKYIKPDVIEDSGKTYQRDTHPLLFKVVDLLIDDFSTRELSVRNLAAETDVSKSWCAVAKRYWKTIAD